MALGVDLFGREADGTVVSGDTTDGTAAWHWMSGGARDGGYKVFAKDQEEGKGR